MQQSTKAISMDWVGHKISLSLVSVVDTLAEVNGSSGSGEGFKGGSGKHS